MPRYTGWRRLSGDTAARPDLLDLGKRMLGELETQRRLSGVQTLSMQRTAPDGSVVTARFVGDVPSIDVQAGNPEPRGRVPEDLSGIVVRPRTFGNAFAFGTNADTLLMLSERKAKSAFFDASYNNATAGGTYSKVFPDGLVKAGNQDWRNKDESLAVTWNSSESRYFPTDAIIDPRVYHNGREIYDARVSLGGYYAYVVGAALRSFGGKHYLLVSLLYDEAYKYEIRAYEVASIHAPLIDPVGADPGVVLATIPVFEWAQFWYPTPLLFNQSATQARTMLHRWGGSETLEVSELVVDLADFSAVTVAELPEATLTSSYDITGETVALGYLNHWAGFVVTLSPCYVPLSGNHQHIEVPSVDRYRCAVDFRDDVPVYAHYLMPRHNETIVRAATIVQSVFGGAIGSADVVETRTLETFDGGLEVEEWLSILSSTSRLEEHTSHSNGRQIEFNKPISQTSQQMRLWWLDLRYKAAAITHATFQLNQQDNKSNVGEFDSYMGELGLIDQNVTSTDYFATTSSKVEHTKVYMAGVVVDEVIATTPATTLVIRNTVTVANYRGGIWKFAGAEWGALTMANSVFPSFSYEWYAEALSSWPIYLEQYEQGEDPVIPEVLPHTPGDFHSSTFQNLANRVFIAWTMPADEPVGGWNDITDRPNDAGRNGAWIAGAKGWAFSMRWVAGSGFQWKSNAATAAGTPLDLETLCGGHTADLFMPIWPLSLTLKA